MGVRECTSVWVRVCEGVCGCEGRWEGVRVCIGVSV